MASVHSLNEALAKVRGVPLGTIEAYSRALRQAGVLPPTKRGVGAAPLTPIMASHVLCAVLGGSPTEAGKNARAVGGLVAASSGDALMEPILARQLDALGWTDGITFSEAIAWLIERTLDDSLDRYLPANENIQIGADRYSSRAWLSWNPTNKIIDAYIKGYREAFQTEDGPIIPARWANGALIKPMEIEFKSPRLHEVKIAYLAGEKEKNRTARRLFWEEQEAARPGDTWGSEFVTRKTLIAIGEVFK
ncbi:hypothetical protein V5F63_08230 [Xanthobacter autotrophicus DSM 597]|uniref:hypothetical protein n=1 Tax=Xanthobacter wiegelii TaxID=3119913 RepID=UPI0037295593